jgi:RsiW-degrading membrane proteinase PrsW (M82 family)
MLVGLLLGLIFVTPLVAVYVVFIRWCARFEAKPWWLVVAAFLWGATISTYAAATCSGFVEHLVSHAARTDVEHPGVQAFGATVLAPLFEEGFKGIGVALIALVGFTFKKYMRGLLDGAIYGGVVGLGFTMTEDILYVATQYRSAGFGGFLSLFFLRTILLGFSHCTFTACTGLGFGVAAASKSWPVKIIAPPIGLASAMAMHAMHNGLPTFFGEGGVVAMILITWCVDFVYFVLLALLVQRDRAIVIRELLNEVGGLLHPRELKLVSSYVAIGRRNVELLFSDGWRAYSNRRKKQLALVELAFLKNRRRKGERGRDLDEKESKLRAEIALANKARIWIGG